VSQPTITTIPLGSYTRPVTKMSQRDGFYVGVDDGTETAELVLTINLDALKNVMAVKAMRNASGFTREAGGAVTVSVVKGTRTRKGGQS